MKTRRVSATKTLVCPRCKQKTTHTLFDAENKVYKCNICGTNTVKK